MEAKDKDLDAIFASLPRQHKRARTHSPFNPKNFVPPVRLLRKGASPLNELLEREDLVAKICRDWDFGVQPSKTLVVSLISSKEMGKTTLLEYLADPSRIPEQKPAQLLRAGKCGRILCVYAPDFKNYPPERLWQMVISQHCATIFSNCSVGGIEFTEANLGILRSPQNALTLSQSMKTWLVNIQENTTENAFNELKRLTSLAFGEGEGEEVVALVDECQTWAEIASGNHKHLLYQAVSAVPTWVRIAIGGLANNRLGYLSDEGTTNFSCIAGELATLSEEAAALVVGQSPITSIVVALARVPRILRLAQQKFVGESPLTLLDKWRYSVNNYYQASISAFPVEDASWIIAATTCRWIVPHFEHEGNEVLVPGTNLSWRYLQSESIITRNAEGQVSLIFNAVKGDQYWKASLEAKFVQLFGVVLEHALFDFGQWFEDKLSKGTATLIIGDRWEYLVNSALVLRYHLLSKQIETSTGVKPTQLPLSTVYECDDKKTYPGNVLSRFDVHLEKAVYGANEVFVSSELTPGLYSNKVVNAAAPPPPHHDAIISCVKPCVSLAVQYRFGASKEPEELLLLPQLKTSNTDATNCILLHICSSADESSFKRKDVALVEAHRTGRLADLSGRGCMNNEILQTLRTLQNL